MRLVSNDNGAVQATVGSRLKAGCTLFVLFGLGRLVLAQPRSNSTSPMKGTIVKHPERITGVWEADEGSAGVVGLTLRLITRIDGQPKTFSGARRYWDGMQIGVYQRHGREHHPGDAN
jgi:hypothetical protein